MVSHNLSKIVPSNNTLVATTVALVDNNNSAVQVEGHTPKVVMLDTGAQPVIIGVQFAKKIGLLDTNLQKSMWQIRTASGVVEEEALFPPGFTIDNWFEHAYYRVDWQTDGLHLGYIPLDLHGVHTPMAHLCVLQDVHTISYINHSLHDWIEEDEEQYTVTQANESSLDPFGGFTPRPEVLHKLQAAHEPLKAIMHKIESLKSHGEPITPILQQPIVWSPPTDGITLLELFGGVATIRVGSEEICVCGH
ncbi:unnamed protein product [Calypogeia fissa]